MQFDGEINFMFKRSSEIREEPKEDELSPSERVDILEKLESDIDQGIQTSLLRHKNDIIRLSEEERKELTETIENLRLSLRRISGLANFRRLVEKIESIRTGVPIPQEQLQSSEENKDANAEADSLFLQNLAHDLIVEVKKKVGELPEDTKAIITAAVSKIEDGKKQIMELTKALTKRGNIKLMGTATALISAGIGVLMGILFLLKGDHEKLSPDKIDKIARQMETTYLRGPTSISQGWGKAPGEPYRYYFLYGEKDVQSLVSDVLHLVESKKPEDLSELEYQRVKQARDILWNPKAAAALAAPAGTVDKLFRVMSQYSTATHQK